MRAKLQQWHRIGGGTGSLYSVSQSLIGLDAEIEDIKKNDKDLIPIGTPVDVMVPDDNSLASELLERAVVFIRPEHKGAFTLIKK